ncbi:hypothetical protein [Halomonas cerina]|uniref:Uncharacterized protein n=1 Tax=Halomonas cerina TaxID=447424 RepID=A0A839VAU6_9GAMM|nr:hypothetical protein [Halomonas cerina]MBB3189626.1 hypothetical protein [Halomonas cerina]
MKTGNPAGSNPERFLVDASIDGSIILLGARRSALGARRSALGVWQGRVAHARIIGQPGHRDRRDARASKTA